MEDVTRRLAVSAAAAGAVGAATMVGSQARAEDDKMMSGSQKLMAGKLSLEPRPVSKEALLSLVERLAQLNVVWQGWQTKGTPQWIDGVSARFAVAPGAAPAALHAVLTTERLRPNIIIFPNGIPPVIDGWGVQVEIAGE